MHNTCIVPIDSFKCKCIVVIRLHNIKWDLRVLHCFESTRESGIGLGFRGSGT